MKLHNKLFIGGALACGFFLTACDDDNDWKPGEQDADTGVSAYFVRPSDTNNIFDATTDNNTWEIPVAISRQVTKGAATVPLFFTSTIEGVQCPQAVQFEDGESEAVFIITCHDVPVAVPGEITVTIDPSQCDVYGIGQNALTLTLIASEWKLISDKVTYYYFANTSSTEKMYPNTYGEMYHLEGTKRFKVTDFYGSGLDMMFDVSSSGTQQFNVLNNRMLYTEVFPEDDDDFGCWYLYDDENDFYPNFVPGDDPDGKEIEYLEFYTVDPDNGYLYGYINMIYNTTTLYGYAGTTVDVQFMNGDFKWGYWQFDWNLLYDPFE